MNRFLRHFQLEANGTTLRRELVAGITTFAAMAYILAVNPAILQAAGMPKDALLTATAVSAAAATVIMALLTNFPIALAPGMGINAYFAYTICVGMGVRWQEALGLVFVNGCIFLLLSVSGVRKAIIRSIPNSLKIAVTVGIGAFIAFIGFQNSGFVVKNDATLVALGNFSDPRVLLFFFGLLLMGALCARRVPGAIVLGIFLLTLCGLFLPDGEGGRITSLPQSLLSMPASLEPTLFKLEFDLFLSHPLKAAALVLTLLFVDMFDNIGSLIGVTRRAGLVDASGQIPKVGRALVADSSAAILSSLVGTSTVVTYIESATGVQAGGRTGLTALTTACCFLLALVFTPLILMVPAVAVAPALVMVGIFMFQAVSDLNPEDFLEFVPAIVTILMMPLAFSISAGMGLGVISLVVLSLLSRRREHLNLTMILLAIAFLLHFLEPVFFQSL